MSDSCDSAEFVRGTGPGDHLPDDLQDCAGHHDGVVDRRPYRFQRPQAHDLKFAPGNAETAEFMDVPEAISLLMDRGRDGLAEDLRVSTDLHLERDAGIQLDDPLYV